MSPAAALLVCASLMGGGPTFHPKPSLPPAMTPVPRLVGVPVSHQAPSTDLPPLVPDAKPTPRRGPPPLSLSRRPRAGEPLFGAAGDIAELPLRHPQAVWLPLEIGAGLHLVTHVLIQGRDTRVLLDTGASTTAISARLAAALGLDAPGVVHYPAKTHDAHGRLIDTYDVDVGIITLGKVRVHGVRATVVDGLQADALVGYDVLREVDMVFAVDQGVLGIYPPGTGFLTARDNVVRIAVGPGPMLLAPLDESGRAAIPFLLDTGASHTLVDEKLGEALDLPVQGGLAADIASLDGTRRRSEGAFVIDHLLLGRERVDVGAVRAWKGRGAMNLLGNDVTLRQRVLLTSEHAELRLAPMPIRPATRGKGPDGKPCAEGPCVRTAVGVARGAPCVGLAVDKVWAGRRIEAVIEVLDDKDENALAGGLFVVRAVVPENGLAMCADAGGVLPAYGVRAGAPASLMRFVARASSGSAPAGDAFSCRGDLCLLFTGAAPAREQAPAASPTGAPQAP